MERYRNNQIHVLFTEKELNFLKNKISSLGYTSISKYFREVALPCVVYDVDITEAYQRVQDTINEINRIGININQIARRVNETHTIYKEDIEEIKQGQLKIWNVLHENLIDK